MRTADLSSFTPRRVLVCQQRQIGDVLLSTPVFRLLHARFPEAELHLFTEEKCVPLLRNNPFINTFHTINKDSVFFNQLAFYHSVSQWHFDLAVNFQQLPRCRTMTFFSRAQVRLSYRCGITRDWLYTHVSEQKNGYACQAKASILAPLGIEWHGEGPEIFLTETEQCQAAELLSACGLHPGSSLICIDSTHRRASKRWPSERWAQLIALLFRASAARTQFLLLRGPGEDESILHLYKLCLAQGVSEKALLVPEPAPSIRLSAACMKLAALHIGGCSAPRHMATALSVPTLTIPGASGSEWRYPSPMHLELRPSLPCQPCTKTACADPQCLLRISPDQAADAALGLLSSYGLKAAFPK